MKDNFLIVAAVILAGAMISGAIIYSGGDNNNLGAGINPDGQIPTQDNDVIVDVSADDDAFKGDENAPVTIIEFSDFECPFCGSFYENALPQIEEKYIKTGKVKFVYRDFPLGFHPDAQKAAEASECARDQEKFWEMHDTIFENQEAIGVSDLKGYAVGLGMNSGAFDTCLDSGKYTSEVQKDLSDGSKAGVDGTPAFFINGRRVVGAQPFSVFEAAIEGALSEL